MFRAKFAFHYKAPLGKIYLQICLHLSHRATPSRGNYFNYYNSYNNLLYKYTWELLTNYISQHELDFDIFFGQFCVVA